MAGCEPKDLLDDVAKFGFEFVERDVQESMKGLEELRAEGGVPHEAVTEEARALLCA